jgi:ubiquinone/menaquinone biosynthesis C-methylase UbiE
MARDVWARRSTFYDLIEGSDLRRGAFKRRLFGRVRGRTLLIAAGTGLDLRHLPPVPVVALDISLDMLARARPRADRAAAQVQLLAADAQCLPFGRGVFDSVVTSCTLCSVPDPFLTLCEIRRVLAPAGALYLFEHVRSRDPVVGLTLDLMTLWSRRKGTDMNRRTLETLTRAGFRLIRVDPVFLDVILAVEARPGS